jgi:rare lipoprotein A (peptidoglycan hydrolase)
MIWQRTLAAVVFCVAPISAQAATVIASIYWPGDGIVPAWDYRTSSGERYNAKAFKCAVRVGDYALGTHLYLHHGRNAVEVVANDHGPFIKNRRLDCTPAVNKALHLDGLGSVRVEYWPPLPKPRPENAP